MTATRRPWWRRWPTVIAAVVVVAAAVGTFIATRGTAVASYRTATAAVGTVQQTVSLTGTLAATHQQGANFAVAGKVTLVAVTPGTKVTAGQVLATVDPATLELTVTKAEATLAAAQSQLAADQTAQAAGGTGAPTDAKLASDQASLESSFAALISAKQDVTDATLVAPIAGTVIAVNVAPGDAVTAKAGSSTSSSSTAAAASAASTATGSSGANRSTASGSGAAQPGAQTGASTGAATTGTGTSTASTDLFVIQDLSAFQVTGTMTAANAAEITAGLNVIVTPSSSTGTVAGTVTSIDPIPTVSNGTATFPYVVTITGLTDGLYSGVSATAAVVIAESDNVLTVPTGAVKTSTSGRTVDKVVDGKRVPTTVTVGLSGGGTTEISTGLSAGDTVAIDTVAASATGGGSNTGFPGGGGAGFPGGGPGVPRG